MLRLTRKVFNDLAIWMIGLGLIMGIIFPFFTTVLGVSSRFVLTPRFFASCMLAGFIVGFVNIVLARKTVGSRLRLLADHMRLVEEKFREMSESGNIDKCNLDVCSIQVDSEDEIGESGRAFNYLIEALALSYRTDASVRSFTEMLASNLELDLLANQALEQLLHHTDAGAGGILIEIEGAVKIAASRGILSHNSLIENEHVRFSLRTGKGQTLVLPDDVLVEGLWTDFRPREVLIDPVFYKGRPLAMIVLASASGFSETNARLDLFRNGLAIALNNALTHQHLQRLAAVDPLTGIYNRRFGMSRLHEEFSRAVRMTSSLGLLMFDIDHFKEVNDTYGHIAGDCVLAELANTVRSVLREGDVLVRYGGEEFLAILPSASKEGSMHWGERLRQIVENTSIPYGDKMIRVTISVGCTSYPELYAEGDQDLVKCADKALYSAKESGRNKVVAA